MNFNTEGLGDKIAEILTTYGINAIGAIVILVVGVFAARLTPEIRTLFRPTHRPRYEAEPATHPVLRAPPYSGKTVAQRKCDLSLPRPTPEP